MAITIKAPDAATRAVYVERWLEGTITKAEIAEESGVHIKAVNNWIQSYTDKIDWKGIFLAETIREFNRLKSQAPSDLSSPEYVRVVEAFGSVAERLVQQDKGGSSSNKSQPRMAIEITDGKTDF